MAQLHVGWDGSGGVSVGFGQTAGFVMLLTRRACYGLLAAQHLAEHAGEGSFSANELFDVIKATDRPQRSSLHSERLQRLGTGNGYHPLRMVGQGLSRWRGGRYRVGEPRDFRNS